MTEKTSYTVRMWEHGPNWINWQIQIGGTSLYSGYHPSFEAAEEHTRWIIKSLQDQRREQAKRTQIQTKSFVVPYD